MQLEDAFEGLSHHISDVQGIIRHMSSALAPSMSEFDQYDAASRAVNTAAQEAAEVIAVLEKLIPLLTLPPICQRLALGVPSELAPADRPPISDAVVACETLLARLDLPFANMPPPSGEPMEAPGGLSPLSDLRASRTAASTARQVIRKTSGAAISTLSADLARVPKAATEGQQLSAAACSRASRAVNSLGASLGVAARMTPQDLANAGKTYASSIKSVHAAAISAYLDHRVGGIQRTLSYGPAGDVQGAQGAQGAGSLVCIPMVNGRTPSPFPAGSYCLDVLWEEVLNDLGNLVCAEEGACRVFSPSFLVYNGASDEVIQTLHAKYEGWISDSSAHDAETLVRSIFSNMFTSSPSWGSGGKPASLPEVLVSLINRTLKHSENGVGALAVLALIRAETTRAQEKQAEADAEVVVETHEPSEHDETTSKLTPPARKPLRPRTKLWIESLGAAGIAARQSWTSTLSQFISHARQVQLPASSIHRPCLLPAVESICSLYTAVSQVCKQPSSASLLQADVITLSETIRSVLMLVNWVGEQAAAEPKYASLFTWAQTARILHTVRAAGGAGTFNSMPFALQTMQTITDAEKKSRESYAHDSVQYVLEQPFTSFIANIEAVLDRGTAARDVPAYAGLGVDKARAVRTGVERGIGKIARTAHSRVVKHFEDFPTTSLDLVDGEAPKSAASWAWQEVAKQLRAELLRGEAVLKKSYGPTLALAGALRELNSVLASLTI